MTTLTPASTQCNKHKSVYTPQNTNGQTAQGTKKLKTGNNVLRLSSNVFMQIFTRFGDGPKSCLSFLCGSAKSVDRVPNTTYQTAHVTKRSKECQFLLRGPSSVYLQSFTNFGQGRLLLIVSNLLMVLSLLAELHQAEKCTLCLFPTGKLKVSYKFRNITLL